MPSWTDACQMAAYPKNAAIQASDRRIRQVGVNWPGRAVDDELQSVPIGPVGGGGATARTSFADGTEVDSGAGDGGADGGDGGGGSG